MATTNTDSSKGTALVTNTSDKPIRCDFCPRAIQPGETYAADFVNCCLECDKSFPCDHKGCTNPPLDNSNWCKDHQDEDPSRS